MLLGAGAHRGFKIVDMIRPAPAIDYNTSMDMGGFQGYAAAVFGLFAVLLGCTFLWVGRMIASRRFSLLEVFAFVTWISIICALAGYVLRNW